jgi:hypothetical protein
METKSAHQAGKMLRMRRQGGAGVLSQLLTGIKTIKDPNLLVGFGPERRRPRYTRSATKWRWLQTVGFFPPIAAIHYLRTDCGHQRAFRVYARGRAPSWRSISCACRRIC